MSEFDKETESGNTGNEKHTRQQERDRLFKGNNNTNENSGYVIFHKKNRKKQAGRFNGHNKKIKQIKLAFAAFIIVIGLLAAAVIIGKFIPTKEKMSGYSYFNTSESLSMLVMLDNEMTDSTGFVESDRVYIPQKLIEDNLNIRFYYDDEMGKVIYTNDTTTFIFQPDSTEYTDLQNQKYTEQTPVVKNVSGELYMDLEFVRRYSNFTYQTYAAPGRIIIDNYFGDQQYVYAKRKSAVRYRAGIKSPILETVTENTRLVYRKAVDDWIEVQTPSGFVGYIKASSVGDEVTEIKEKTYTDSYSSIKKDYKISLAWFQATNQAANSNIGNYLNGTQGITTISPTWYSISSNAGDMSSLASKSVVEDLHAKGYEVWPLVDDFASGLDGEILYASKSSRTNMINTLVGDAIQYGYDGLNLDCEKVKSSGVKHYLQFVRELSVACRANNIVLSIDNYKPATYNAYYNLAEQSVYADYIVIMGYDEHYTGSDSGSVASIGFVEEGIQGALEQVSNEKLINAIPFFTRIWTVSGTNTTSKAVGMQSALDNLQENGVPAVWDEQLGQYFGAYEKDGATIQIWLEEDKSVEEKMKVIKQYNLAGVAQWKLGLEKKSVWTVIAQYNQ